MRTLRSLSFMVMIKCATAPIVSAGPRQPAPGSGTSPLRRVRTADARVQLALDKGMRRSQTFCGLIDSLEQSQAFVYIVRVPHVTGRVEGCVPLEVRGAGEDRYVRILLKAGLDVDRVISVIGHEAQYVLEILEQADAPLRNQSKQPDPFASDRRSA